MKDLSKLQIQDINGSWEVKSGKVNAVYQFMNGHLSIIIVGLPIQSEHANIHVSGKITRLVAGPDILDIELITAKFMIAKKVDGGSYFLFVKVSEN